MEVYTLDSLLRRTELFDEHESLIWVERFRQYGDFELKLASTYRSRSLLKPDTLLSMDRSLRVMRIDTVEDNTDDSNMRMLTVKGKSIESMLTDRTAKDSTSNLTTSPSWNITGLTATNAARKIFHDICVTGILSPYDVIPYIYEGSFAEFSNISEPTSLVEVRIEPNTVYDAIVNIADIWDFGFRILREDNTTKLWFDVYTGSDRTAGQSLLPAVVFSQDLDNLHNVTRFSSSENAKNVAYVYSPDGFEMVYADDVDPTTMGFDRRVLTITASDITTEEYPDPEDLSGALITRGKDELAKLKAQEAFDGEISQFSQYIPGRDFNVGDLVEQQDGDGNANQMRVSEIIYASDKEGERAYPTLTMNRYINAGSWLSATYSKYWTEMGTEEWADQP